MASSQDILEVFVYDNDGNIIQSDNKSWLRKQENDRLENLKKEAKAKEKKSVKKDVLKTGKSDKKNKSKVEAKEKEEMVVENG